MKKIRARWLWVIAVLRTSALILLAIVVFFGCAVSFAQDTGAGIDLVIVGGLDMYPLLPEEGDDVVIGILVSNRGTSNAHDVAIYFYEDEVRFEKETVDIRAGDTVYVESYWTADSGDSYISVAVDPAGDYAAGGKSKGAGAWVTVR